MKYVESPAQALFVVKSITGVGPTFTVTDPLSKAGVALQLASDRAVTEYVLV